MPKNQRRKLIVIVGPTASGKSGLGIYLAQKFGGEIISADSRQVYKGMDIGTGKVLRDKTLPNSKFKILNLKLKNNFYSSDVKHHLLDVADPKKVFTVSDFKKLGGKAVDDIVSHHKLPIVVGGTGFYVDALVHNIAVPEVPPNKKLRAELAKQSAEQLFSRLLALDPRRAKTIDPKNKRRLVRALEIILSTGRPVPKLESSIKYQVLWLGLKPKNLEKRIEERLDTRLKQGMVKEVQKLHKQGVSWKRLDELGLEYRWISKWLKSHKLKTPNPKSFLNSQEYENLFRNIIKYSKRQMTWFKRNKEIHWIKNPVKASGPRGFTGQKEAAGLVGRFIL